MLNLLSNFTAQVYAHHWSNASKNRGKSIFIFWKNSQSASTFSTIPKKRKYNSVRETGVKRIDINVNVGSKLSI